MSKLILHLSLCGIFYNNQSCLKIITIIKDNNKIIDDNFQIKLNKIFNK
jgi:hypothetical protein